MKNILLTLFFITALNNLFGQAEKTIISSFNLNGTDTIYLNLKHVTINTWDLSYGRIYTKISINGGITILNSLISQSRYSPNLKYSSN